MLLLYNRQTPCKVLGYHKILCVGPCTIFSRSSIAQLCLARIATGSLFTNVIMTSCIPARPSESLAAAVAAILKAERPRPTAQRMRRSMVNPLHWLVGRAPVVVASNSEPKIDCICVVIEKSNRHRTQLTLLIWVNSLRMKF